MSIVNDKSNRPKINAQSNPIKRNTSKYPSKEELDKYCASFWDSLEKQWPVIYESIITGTHDDRWRTLQLFNYFAGPLANFIDIEITVGQLNRIAFDTAADLVELYISPKLLVANIPIMNEIVDKQRKIPNLQVFRYRAYNSKDTLIRAIEYEDTKFEYMDFGCQYFNGISENKTPLINIVIYIKKDAAQKLLVQKEITFIDAEQRETKLLKWMPTKLNVVDILLVNIIGEYNLIHRTGYIEFLPENDPLIAAGSVFTELSDLRGAYAIIDKISKTKTCVVCSRAPYQSNLLTCSKCRQTKYCCVKCQLIDFPIHERLCLSNP